MTAQILRACNNCGGTDRYKDGKCKACVRKRVDLYTEKNRASKLEYGRQWRVKNIEKVQEHDRVRATEFRKAEPEKRKAIYTKYVIQNKEKVAASKRSWKQRNPEAARDARAVRRARMEAAGGSKLPRGTIARLQELQKGKCACCLVQMNGVFHVDHIQALAKGGLHEAKNLQLLCPPCNLSKSARDPVEFMQSRGYLL